MWRKRVGKSESEKVGCVAGLLGKSDLEVFALAYQNWYAETPGNAQLEYHFEPYLTDGEVPFWVRSYVRSILDRHGQQVHRRIRRDCPVGF